MEILVNHPLQNLNTFNIAVVSQYFVTVYSLEDLQEVLDSEIAQNNAVLILGGGSNILFTQDYQGLIILNHISSIKIVKEDDEVALVAAAGGVVWQDLVNYALKNNLGGIENLSLIPGTVGAAPIQNIGAYGVELKEVMVSLEAYNLSTGKVEIFSNEACKFDYRNSVFKNELRGKYMITNVLLQLNKHPQINTSYGAISSVMEEQGINNPTIRDVSNAVIGIRKSKLPNPTEIGNAGSFFKNPIIDTIDYEGLKLSFPDIPGYVNNKQVKIPAAWLIEQCGWKGKRFGAVGVHAKQPLVLVNYGGGTGSEIKKLAEDIQQSIGDKFGIVLEPEPQII